MVKDKDKNNNSSNSLVFGRWPQTKTPAGRGINFNRRFWTYFDCFTTAVHYSLHFAAYLVPNVSKSGKEIVSGFICALTSISTSLVEDSVNKIKNPFSAGFVAEQVPS